MSAELAANQAEIQRARALLCAAGEVCELRALNTTRATVSGYYNDFEALARDAAGCSDMLKAPGVYLTLNPVRPELLARANNRLEGYAKHTTSDANIIRRCWLPLDFDPGRPAGISATDVEHVAALAKAQQVRDFLREHGWPDPLFIDSGNGAYLLFRMELPVDDASRDLLKGVLDALAMQFNDEHVAIDRTMFNAARIIRLPGTVNRKGDPLPDRPHRLVRIIEVPDAPAVVARELLEALAGSEPASERPQSKAKVGKTGARFNLDDFLQRHNINIKRIDPYQGGRRIILEACVFDPDHNTGTSVAIIEGPDGKLGYACQHEGCADKHWSDVRELFEPGYRERKADAAHSSPHGGKGKKQPTQADELLTLGRDNASFFHDAEENCYAAAKVNQRVETHPIRSRAFRHWLLRLYFKETGRSPNAEALGMAVNTMEAIAHFEGECRPVSLRIASHGGKVYVDLCNQQWQVAEIDREGCA